MSKEEFEDEYCICSCLTKEEYEKYFITIPCDNKKGWIMAHKDV